MAFFGLVRKDKARALTRMCGSLRKLSQDRDQVNEICRQW